MNPADAAIERKAFADRARELEAKRLAAGAAHQLDRERRLAGELRRLWARHVALERKCAA